MNASGGANIGGSSILVIFVLLCITTFATLAMVSATTSFRLATQLADAGAQFYEADTRAEEILADISRVLRGEQPLGDHHELYETARNASIHPTGGYVNYTVSFSHNMRIDVSLFIEGQNFTITSWTTGPVYDPAEYGGGQIILLAD